MNTKFQLFFWLSLVAVVLSSCLESNTNYTPSITAFRPVLCTHAQDTTVDTLNIKRLEATGYYQIDTIVPGDTVRMSLRLDAYGNALTHFVAVYDTSVLDLNLNIDSIQVAFDMSKTGKDYLVFKPGYNMAKFPLEYVAKRRGASKIALRLETDSEFSPAEVSLYQVVD